MSDQARGGLLSPFLQSQRLRAAEPHVTGAVLEIGCGNGAATEFCAAESYYGFDIDAGTVEIARASHPGFTFSTDLPAAEPRFDTVLSLAVIEHLPDPGGSMIGWARYLKPGGKMVLTTPLPAFEWAHELGAKIGLFSHDAAEEHEVLIDRESMEQMLAGSDLRIAAYERFLFGANQLFVLARDAA